MTHAPNGPETAPSHPPEYWAGQRHNATTDPLLETGLTAQYPEVFKATQREVLPQTQLTDMQFNIGRLEGNPPRGMDLVDPDTGERFYVTSNSDEEAERRLATSIPDIMLPREVRDGVPEGVSIYKLPEGARLLTKTLRNAPYSQKYMQKLAESMGGVLRKISVVDPGMFGISLDEIAVGHSSDEETDDVRLFVVPPLKTAHGQGSSAQQLLYSFPSHDPGLRIAFVKGFNGGE